MATNPQLPREPEQEQRLRAAESEEWKGSRPFPWALVGAMLMILAAIGIAWYFFH